MSSRTLPTHSSLPPAPCWPVVGIELVEAIETSLPWVPVVAFIAGGAIFIAIDHTTDVINARKRCLTRHQIL